MPRPKVTTLKANSKATLSNKSVTSIIDDISNGLRIIESNLIDEIEINDRNDVVVNNQFSATISYGRLLTDVSLFLRRECLNNFAKILRSDKMYLSNRNLNQVDNSENNRLGDPQVLSSLITRLVEL